LIFLDGFNSHLAGLLVAHKLSDLVKEEDTHQYDNSHGHGGTNESGFGKVSRQILVKVEVT
jgi:hypothetical protein